MPYVVICTYVYVRSIPVPIQLFIVDAQEIFVQLTGNWMLFAADVREGASLWAVVVGPSDEMQKET